MFSKKCRPVTFAISLGLAMMVLSPTSFSSTVDGTDSLVVKTDKGYLRGITADGVENFLGIPYAGAPAGSLRWRPPQPVAPWSGVRSAQTYGSFCPQLKGLDAPDGPVLDEDCLFLNVQRPVGTGISHKLPVFIYIHGGGFRTGSGDKESLFKIVGSTPMVGVTLNYRLGILGFLDLPSLAAESGEDGNYGFLDQQAALRWVQRNIARFGGDPRDVTIGGQSSGAISVCYHLTAPGSEGLFSKAIMQSGSCTTHSVAQARAQGGSLAASAGCTSQKSTAACMRSKSVLDLLQIQASFFGGTRGTRALPRDPHSQVVSGNFERVPLMIGGNRDEARSFVQSDVGYSRSQFTSLMALTFGSNVDAVLRHYPYPANSSDPSAVAYQIAAALTDLGWLGAPSIEYGIGGCGNALLTDTFAHYVPVYSYEFSNRKGPGWYSIPGYVWGAGHATELPYLLPLHDGGATYSTFSPGDVELSDDMVRFWGAFVQRANPNVAGQAPWPQYNKNSSLLELKAGEESSAISVDEFRQQHKCHFWDKLRGELFN